MLSLHQDKEKKLHAEIEKVYTKSGSALAAMNESVAELSTKYGSHSKSVLRMIDQISTFIELHDKSLEYINHLREMNYNMYGDYFSRELTRHKKATGLPYVKLVQMLGYESEDWERADRFDLLIDSVSKDKDRDDEDSIEHFIATFKKR